MNESQDNGMVLLTVSALLLTGLVYSLVVLVKARRRALKRRAETPPDLAEIEPRDGILGDKPDMAERFQDPVAQATDWTPLAGGGSNIKTNTLVQLYGNERIEYTASRAVIAIMCSFFVVVPFMTWLLIEPHTRNGGLQINDNTIGPIFICVSICGIAALTLFSITRKRVFDKKAGYYWRGRTAPTEAFDPANVTDAVKLTDIHALQLVREIVKFSGNRRSQNTYHSYELNLVLIDGRRVNVVDHGSAIALQADAKILSDFLGVPVWDVIEPDR